LFDSARHLLKLSVYGATMAIMREAWTDERLDDFKERVDQRFDEVDRRFDAVDRRFDRLEARFDDLNRRFDHLQFTLVAGLIGLIALQLT
jgi:hypothetical protein